MAFDTNTSGKLDLSKFTVVTKKRLIVHTSRSTYINDAGKTVTRLTSHVRYSEQDYTVKQYSYDNSCICPSAQLRSSKATELVRHFTEQKQFTYSKQTRAYVNSTNIVADKMSNAINKHNDKTIRDNMRKFNADIKLTRISNETYEKRLANEVLLNGTIGLDTSRLTRTQKKALGLI